MATVNEHGRPEIIANSEGFPTTPSIVHFYDENACVVGEEAVKMVVIDPENVVRFIKRHMGEEDYTLEFYGKPYTAQEISALILRKLIVTTAVTLVLWLCVFAVVESGWISFRTGWMAMPKN